MSLDLGTLRGFLDLDDTKFDQGLDKAGDSLKDFGDKGAKYAAIAGAAIAGAMVASLVGGMNIEAANDKLASQLGLTEKQAQRSGEVAGRLYANAYGGSLEEVNAATGAVISSIEGMRKANAKELELATRDALNYAAAFEIDVTKAVSVAGVVMKAGLAKDSTEAFDLLTAASQRVPAQLREDVLDAAEEYSQFFATLGYSGEQAFAMLVDGADKGMYGIDKAGDAIKEFTIRSTDMSTASKDAYKIIGLNAKEMADDILAGGDRAQGATQKIIDGLLSIESPSKRANAAIALFGTPLEDLNASEIPDFLRSMQDGGDAMKGFGGSAEDLDKTLNDNAVASLESLKRQAKATFTGMMNWALPAVEDLTKALAEDFGPAIEAAVGWIKDHKEELGPYVAGLAGAAVALGAVILAVKLWAAAQAILNIVLAANPIGLVIIAIGALVGGLIYAYKKSETFREAVHTLAVGFLTLAEWAVRSFRMLLEAALWTFDKILWAAEKGLGWIPGLGDKIKGAREHFDDLGDRAVEKLKGIEDKLRDTAREVANLDAKQATVDVVLRVRGQNKARNDIDNFFAGTGYKPPEGATGGIVTRPTLALIGEAGPEAVVPLNRTPGSSPLPMGGDFDWDRLEALMRSRPAPLIGHQTVMPHNYSEFRRQQEANEMAGAVGGADFE